MMKVNGQSAAKRIAILGSTGSIGTQALDVVRENPQLFEVEVLTAHSNAALLISQAQEFVPNAVVIGLESQYETVKSALAALPIKVYAGAKALASIVEMESIDIVLTALVGFAGLVPTMRAIEAGKPIALANKETLVVAGQIVTAAAMAKGVNIYPVDSEHSAIFQCLVGEHEASIEKLILTASGGPFRGKGKDFLQTVTPAQALKHPNWDMGAKITIDSASLMNKGLEVIEACWLFGLPPEKVEVVVHPQSIIHSMVQFCDGSMKAQLGLPDMKLPIQYALGYPSRVENAFPRFDFKAYPTLTFEEVDWDNFPNLSTAYAAIKKGGNAPCIINAINEVVVAAFLKEQVGFMKMSEIVVTGMEILPHIHTPNLEDLLQTDLEARAWANEKILALA